MTAAELMMQIQTILLFERAGKYTQQEALNAIARLTNLK